ncbi:hypothetical protein OAS39_07950 [Pirellulales bacterium]|nr:hypothetical protein [Pirellulales bacterium]
MSTATHRLLASDLSVGDIVTLAGQRFQVTHSDEFVTLELFDLLEAQLDEITVIVTSAHAIFEREYPLDEVINIGEEPP